MFQTTQRQFKKKIDNLSWLSCQKLEMSVFDTLSYMNSFLGDSRMSGGQEILGLSNWILAVWPQASYFPSLVLSPLFCIATLLGSFQLCSLEPWWRANRTVHGSPSATALPGGCANHWLVSMTPEACLVANLLWQHKGHHSCAGFHAPSIPIITSSPQLFEETIASFSWIRGLKGLN